MQQRQPRFTFWCLSSQCYKIGIPLYALFCNLLFSHLSIHHNHFPTSLHFLLQLPQSNHLWVLKWLAQGAASNEWECHPQTAPSPGGCRLLNPLLRSHRGESSSGLHAFLHAHWRWLTWQEALQWSTGCSLIWVGQASHPFQLGMGAGKLKFGSILQNFKSDDVEVCTVSNINI